MNGKSEVELEIFEIITNILTFINKFYLIIFLKITKMNKIIETPCISINVSNASKRHCAWKYFQ